MSKAVLLSWRSGLCACCLRVLPAWQRKRDEFADANSGNRFRQDAGSGVFVADKCRDVVGGRRQAAQAETGRALSWLACSGGMSSCARCGSCFLAAIPVAHRWQDGTSWLGESWSGMRTFWPAMSPAFFLPWPGLWRVLKCRGLWLNIAQPYIRVGT